jgi:pSer/pThr/pTyr-binding forkhead associated (FHA) protein
MIQIKVLSGDKSGTVLAPRRLPVRIGRDPKADLRLEESGVWDLHLQIDLVAGESFTLRARPEASVAVNGQPVKETVLLNGDTIEIGSLKLQFWLTEPRQTGLRWRESLTWLAIAAISLAQIWLIYLLST